MANTLTDMLSGDTWSFSLGRWFCKIPVRVHYFIFLVILLSFQNIREQFPEMGLLNTFGLATFLTITLYVFIYLHELGHGIAGLRSGIPVPKIILHPLGGYAVMGLPYRSANQEFVVSACGPLVNTFFAALFGFLLYADMFDFIRHVPGWIYMVFVLSYCFGLNLYLGVFNLLPIFPFDGAHMLRAVLSFKGSPNKSTYQAANIGLVMLAIIAVGTSYLLYTGVITFPNRWFTMSLMMFLICLFACLSERARAYDSDIYHPSAYSDGVDPWHAGYDQGHASFSVELKPEPGFWEKRRIKKTQAEIEQKQVHDRDLRHQLDDILGKIKREGMDSLSRAERKTLKEASEHFKGQGRS